MAKVEDDIEKMVEETGVSEAPKPKKAERSFKMISDARIPISPKRGKMWKARIAQARRRVEKFKEAWDEAMEYYNNDQLGHRNGSATRGSRIEKGEGQETENVVFANVSAMTPRLFSKNPDAEITSLSGDDTQKLFATVCEHLIDAVAARHDTPGINLKPKVRRAIVLAQLTNLVWASVDYVTREQSSQVVQQDLIRLSKELEEAKDQETIDKLEGQLMALDEQFDMTQPSGPTLEILPPDSILVDPNAQETDFSDAKWMARCDVLPTAYLQAKYMKKDSEGRDTLVFKPDYIVRLSNKDNDDKEDFDIFNSDESKSYGYDNKEDFERAKRSKVWFVWDKVTRRVELYLDNDFEWPVWVWNDPLHLESFFPFTPLSFVTPLEGPYSKGEVSYYLDQQDSINEINEHVRLARNWARYNVWYNSRYLDENTVTKALEGGNKLGIHGVKLPDGVDFSQALFSITPPGTEFMQLFDKSPLYASIDRVSAMNEAGRGGQYKTNTTNVAIEQYETSRSIRISDKVDTIEDWLGKIYWNILQLCLQNMKGDEVANLIGAQDAAVWDQIAPMDPKLIRRFLSSFTIAGGSTQKPNTEAKKEQAVEVAQTLGQFAGAAPMALVVALKTLEQAFDDFTIREEDWKLIIDSIMGQQQQEAPAQGQAPMDEATLRQFLASVPPEAKQQIVALIQKGTDPMQAIQQVTGQVPS